MPQRNTMHFYSIKPFYLKNEKKKTFLSNLTNSDNQFIFTNSSNSLKELRFGIITIVVAILLNQRSIVAKKPSILIKLLADQQWCCSFVWNIQKKVIGDSAQSEIDCLIEWCSMGSFSYFLYICLVRDKKNHYFMLTVHIMVMMNTGSKGCSAQSIVFSQFLS